MLFVTLPDTRAALYAYSQVVTAVAADLTPHVAALQVTGPDGRPGAGSAVVAPGGGRGPTDADHRGRARAGTRGAVGAPGGGLLRPNAHVVGRARTGRAVFDDGSETPVEVVGTDPL